MKQKTVTPSSHWSECGLPDPHGDTYDCERENLTMGNFTDDELANAVFLHGDMVPNIQDVLSGKAYMPIVYLTAAKERIRWLSRQIDKLEGERDAALGIKPVKNTPYYIKGYAQQYCKDQTWAGQDKEAF